MLNLKQKNVLKKSTQLEWKNVLKNIFIGEFSSSSLLG